jgi:signal transduction histidine kinase/DNA-binding response OmpR family regulator/HPt (histidine-containing phosphotransfer) domain-containing protein
MLKVDTTFNPKSPAGNSRSRRALLGIAYLPATVALIFTVTCAVLLWRARTAAFAAMEDRLNSALLANQIDELSRTWEVDGAFTRDALAAKNPRPPEGGPRLAASQCADLVQTLRRTLDSQPNAKVATTLLPLLGKIALDTAILDHVGEIAPALGGKDPKVLLNEVDQTLEEMKTVVQEHEEAAISQHAEKSRQLVVFERVFVACSMLFIATIIVIGRSLARLITAERAEAAHQQSLFEAGNRADIQAKQALLDSIQNAQSRFIASGDLLPIIEQLLADLLGLTGSSFGFICELLPSTIKGPQLGAHVVTNRAGELSKGNPETEERTSAEVLALLNLLVKPLLGCKEPTIIDRRFQALPPGFSWPNQPHLHSMLALPVLHGTHIIGIVGIANRPGGYDNALAYFLLPLIGTCGKLFQACSNERSERQSNLDRQKFVFLVENSSDCIGMATLDGRMFFLNAAGRRLLGLNSSTPIALTCLWDFYYEGGEKFFQEKALPSLRRTGRWESEVMVRDTSTQEPVAVFQNVFLVSSDDKSEPLYVAVVNRDISESKRAASALHQAKEEAEAANRAKSEFLANMSHEVRTPMVAILGFAEMLLDSRLPPEERKHALQDISRNGKHLLQVINDILDLSKIEAGKLPLEFGTYSPWQIVLETIRALRVPEDENQVRLEAFPVGELPRTILTDPRRVRQILFNLVSNAIKFTEKNRRVVVKLTMDVERKALLFDVKDEGIGISESQMNRLFFPFEQGDSSTTRRFGGTGLGLSISKRLAQLLGGDITAASKPGEGSRFVFQLPIDVAHVSDWIGAKALELESIVDLEADNPVSSCSGRILLAEDNHSSQRVIQYCLQKAGLEVELAANGRIAVQKALETPFDLILMDMQMPELDGYGATIELRQQGCQCPIIALTAHAMRGDREKCQQAGCDDYLTKPVESHKLIATIVHYLAATPSQLASSLAAHRDAARQAEAQAQSAEDSEMPPTVAAVVDPNIRNIPSRLRSAFLADRAMQPLIAEYVAGLRPHVADLHKAIVLGDLKRVGSLAHQSKGSGGMYGYPLLTEAAGSLETAAKIGASTADLLRHWDMINVISHAIQLGLRERE